MHEEKRRRLAQHFVEMLNAAREAARDESKQRGPDAIRNGFDMTFVNDKPFFGLTELILREPTYKDKFSREYIREQLLKAIYGLAQGGDITEESATASVEALDTKLEGYSELAEVYVPLVGIKMTLPKMELGNVTLVNMDEARFEMIKQRLMAGKSFSGL